MSTNVAFRRGDNAYINSIAVTDGQILFDTESQAIYMDNGSVRGRYGGGNLSRSDVDTALKADSENPVQNKVIYANVLKKTDVINTLSSAIAVTDTQVPVGCGVAKELNNKISNSSDAYNPTKPYKIGDLCIHDNKLYRCITACSAGSWTTNQSCFMADTLVNVVDGVNNYEISYIYGRGGADFRFMSLARKGKTIFAQGFVVLPNASTGDILGEIGNSSFYPVSSMYIAIFKTQSQNASTLIFSPDGTIKCGDNQITSGYYTLVGSYFIN